MAKKVLKVGSYVDFRPDKGNRNQDGKTVAYGKVIRFDEETGSADVLVSSDDHLGPFVASGVYEGEELGSFTVVDQPKDSKERKLYEHA